MEDFGILDKHITYWAITSFNVYSYSKGVSFTFMASIKSPSSSSARNTTTQYGFNENIRILTRVTSYGYSAWGFTKLTLANNIDSCHTKLVTVAWQQVIHYMGSTVNFFSWYNPRVLLWVTQAEFHLVVRIIVNYLITTFVLQYVVGDGGAAIMWGAGPWH